MNALMFLCSAPFLLIALALFARGWMHYKKSLARTDWPVAAGEIISSEVKASQTDNSANYFPMIHYRYKVNLVEYESNVVRLSESVLVGTGRNLAQTRVDKYPAGQAVNVYYDPEQPEKSTLETEMSYSGISFYGVLGLGFLAAGLLAAYIMYGVQ
jgi:uncharacterized membrane protein YbaN (DUF454 family)